ncbi:MAG: hypothetical protein AB8E15_13685 [Bdellovibrionales bacterium]
MIQFLTISIILLSTSLAQAKVFNLSKQTVSTFLRGSYATPTIGSGAYSDSSGNATTGFSKEASYNTTGEFGLFFTTPMMGIRFSYEFLQAQPLEGVSAGASSTEYMTIDSRVVAKIPKIGFEFGFATDNNSKYYLNLNFGYAQVELVNDYSFTGASPYGVGDYTERGESTIVMGDISLGWEYNFSEDSTLLVDAGYRVMTINRLTHTAATTTINGGVTAGDALTNNDSTDRAIDLSGAYIGLGFRFYINY